MVSYLRGLVAARRAVVLVHCPESCAAPNTAAFPTEVQSLLSQQQAPVMTFIMSYASFGAARIAAKLRYQHDLLAENSATPPRTVSSKPSLPHLSSTAKSSNLSEHAEAPDVRSSTLQAVSLATTRSAGSQTRPDASSVAPTANTAFSKPEDVHDAQDPPLPHPWAELQEKLRESNPDGPAHGRVVVLACFQPYWGPILNAVARQLSPYIEVKVYNPFKSLSLGLCASRCSMRYGLSRNSSTELIGISQWTQPALNGGTASPESPTQHPPGDAEPVSPDKIALISGLAPEQNGSSPWNTPGTGLLNLSPDKLGQTGNDRPKTVSNSGCFAAADNVLEGRQLEKCSWHLTDNQQASTAAAAAPYLSAAAIDACGVQPATASDVGAPHANGGLLGLSSQQEALDAIGSCTDYVMMMSPWGAGPPPDVTQQLVAVVESGARMHLVTRATDSIQRPSRTQWGLPQAQMAIVTAAWLQRLLVHDDQADPFLAELCSRLVKSPELSESDTDGDADEAGAKQIQNEASVCVGVTAGALPVSDLVKV